MRGLSRRAVMLAALPGVSALQAGCAINTDHNHEGPESPAAAGLPAAPRVAWVFSSGGPRGFVHVGVIKALDELGLAPDLLVGASVGAMVSVLRAGGISGAELEQLALGLSPLGLARVARVLGGEGERFSGAPLAELVREQLQQRQQPTLLERLPLRVACVAHATGSPGSANAAGSGRTLAFTRGDAGLAVQAAAAVEGQFTPVRIRGLRHVDADRFMPLPVRLARELGAQRVLAVDASAHEDKAPAEAARYREGDLRKRALTQPDAAAADLLLHPFFGYWVSLSQDFRQRAIEAGYRATLAQAAQLRALHAG